MEPKVNLGNRLTGLHGDTIQTGFEKYNRHTHPLVTPLNFFMTTLKVGQKVKVLDVDGLDAFLYPPYSNSPIILEVLPFQLKVSRENIFPVNSGVLYANDKIIVEGVTTIGNIIHLDNTLGSMSPKMLSAVLTETLSYQFTSPGTYPLVVYFPYTCRIVNLACTGQTTFRFANQSYEKSGVYDVDVLLELGQGIDIDIVSIQGLATFNITFYKCI